MISIQPVYSNYISNVFSAQIVKSENILNSRDEKKGCVFIYFSDDNVVVRFANGTDYRPSVGTVCMIPENTGFVINDSAVTSIQCIMCSGSLVSTFMKACGAGATPKFTMRPTAIEAFEILENMLKMCDGGAEALNRCAAQMYILITEIAFATVHIIERKPSIIAQKIKSYIDSNIQEDISVNLIARNFYLSETHVIRIFKDKYGEPPKQYMLKKKIDESKKMLIDTSLQIKEIAMIFHFADSYHFSHTFKRFTGYSPVNYRLREDVNRIHTTNSDTE